MKSDRNIQNKVDDTFKAIETIKPARVSPFFKEKTLQRLFTEKEETSLVWSWFTPQVQLATFVCILILNVLMFTKLHRIVYHENVSEFAKSYELSTSTKVSLFDLP